MICQHNTTSPPAGGSKYIRLWDNPTQVQKLSWNMQQHDGVSYLETDYYSNETKSGCSRQTSRSCHGWRATRECSPSGSRHYKWILWKWKSFSLTQSCQIRDYTSKTGRTEEKGACSKYLNRNRDFKGLRVSLMNLFLYIWNTTQNVGPRESSVKHREKGRGRRTGRLNWKERNRIHPRSRSILLQIHFITPVPVPLPSPSYFSHSPCCLSLTLPPHSITSIYRPTRTSTRRMVWFKQMRWSPPLPLFHTSNERETPTVRLWSLSGARVEGHGVGPREEKERCLKQTDRRAGGLSQSSRHECSQERRKREGCEEIQRKRN